MTTTNAIWILENRVKCNKEEKEEAIQLAVKALKAVPQQGHWIPVYPFTDPRDDQECSECGQIYPGATRYCPDCGAKMFEPQESEVEE